MGRLPALLLIAALGAAGCGDEGLDYERRTPPPYIGAEPVAPPGQRLVQRTMTAGDADRLKPVISGWATAVRTGDIARAAGFFSLPSIVSRRVDGGALQVNSPRVAEAFNASLPCGAKLVATKPDGRFVVGTFLLVDVGTAPCRERGRLARFGFVFGDRDHPRRFSELWRLSTTPDARAGPAQRPVAVAPATVGDFG